VLRHGAQVNGVDESGRSALMVAADKGQSGTVGRWGRGQASCWCDDGLFIILYVLRCAQNGTSALIPAVMQTT